MRIPRLLAHKRVEDARELVAVTKEKLHEEFGENRASYERFYNNLAIFSGSTMALSITYLGYLKSVHQQLSYQNLLIASWTSFLICLGLALFHSFFYANYIHYGRTRELHLNRKRQCETELAALPDLNMPELTLQADREAHAGKLQAAIPEFGKDAKWAEQRESFFHILWDWGGLAARLAFVLGFVMLYFFAVMNI